MSQVNTSDYFDVAIIGGGVSGCSTAYFLAAEPAFDGRIAVIERDPTYANAPSARAAGVIRLQFSTPENIEMSRFAAHFIKHIGDYLSVEGEAPQVDFRERGFLLLADEANHGVIEDNCKTQHGLGVNTTVLTKEDVQRRYPYIDTARLVGGSIGDVDEGWLDPYSLLQAYRRKARAEGVTFITGEVIACTTEGDAFAVDLGNAERLACGCVVNASGARDIGASVSAMGVELPISPRKRTMFAFDCRDLRAPTPHIMLPTGVSVRSETRGFLAAASPPAGWPDEEDHGIEPDHALFDEYIWPKLAEIIPAFESTKLTSAYCCHYDLNLLDENVIIDHLPNNDRYFFVAGFSGHGLQQSPAIGRALSELITFGEYRTLDLSRFGYDRVRANAPLRESNCY